MIPQALLEHAQKKSGLILLAGDRFSFMDRTILELSHQLKEMGKKGCLILRQSPQTFQVGSPFLLVQYSELNQPIVQKNVSDCDCLIFEKIMDFEELEWGLQMADEGRMVIAHVSTSSIVSALHRLFSLWPAAQREHWAWRWSENLQLMMSQVFVTQSGSDYIWAHEVALASPNVKSLLKKGEIANFENELKKAEDKSGLVSLNQSLLQLIIRRKIDIKLAFEMSRDPEDLDGLLKKVGI